LKVENITTTLKKSNGFRNPLGIFKVEILLADSKQIKPIFLVRLVPLFKQIGVSMAPSLKSLLAQNL
jgi:hypothetical protein